MNSYRSISFGWAAAAAFCGSLAVLTLAVEAQTIPPLDDLSAAFVKAHGDIAARRTHLQAERDVLRARNQAFNAACKAVEEGSAQEAKCLSDRAALDAAVNAHIRETKQYNGAAETAVVTDASVVDARNVPSGLPKSVEDQLPRGEVGDRVRKGYEAIQGHHWNVARAWFQDALNHAPGDPGIRRLVDLALQAEAAQVVRAAPLVSPAYKLYLQHQQDPAARERWNAFIKNDLPRHQELTDTIRTTLSSLPAGPLTAQQARNRAAQLRIAAKAASDSASREAAFSVFADVKSDSYSFETEASDLHAAVSIAMERRARDVEACRCEPPLQRPADSDIEFLFHR
jgi:hypothetical protein